MGGVQEAHRSDGRIRAIVTDDVDVDEAVLQRVTCTELRMRLEEAADRVMQEVFGLERRPYTREIVLRIMAVLGWIPYPPGDQEWRVVANAVQAYRMLCNVLHGRNAWNRVPQAQLDAWAAAVETYERLLDKPRCSRRDVRGER